ncbi:MAG: hypothetical protein ACPGGK_09820 [Pikeienuella sp.]
MLFSIRSIFFVCIGWLLTACAQPVDPGVTKLTQLATVPQIEFSEFAVGDYVVFEQSDIGLLRFTVTKIENGLYTFEGRVGGDGSGPLYYRVIDTIDGKRTSLTTKGGTVIYEPHGCFRTLGSCTYTAVEVKTGIRREFTVEGEIKGNRYFWRRYHHGIKVAYGSNEFETAFGLPVEYELTSGSRRSGRLVKIERAADLSSGS